jgi:hypothetical protein
MPSRICLEELRKTMKSLSHDSHSLLNETHSYLYALTLHIMVMASSSCKMLTAWHGDMVHAAICGWWCDIIWFSKESTAVFPNRWHVYLGGYVVGSKEVHWGTSQSNFLSLSHFNLFIVSISIVCTLFIIIYVCHIVITEYVFCLLVHYELKAKAVPLYAMKVLGGREGMPATNSRPRH